MRKGANIEVADMGANVTAARFVESVKRYKPKLVGLSALLTTTMPVMRDTVKAIRDEGFKAQFTAEAFNLASHPNLKMFQPAIEVRTLAKSQVHVTHAF